MGHIYRLHHLRDVLTVPDNRYGNAGGFNDTLWGKSRCGGCGKLREHGRLRSHRRENSDHFLRYAGSMYDTAAIS